ncbi:MAG: aminotransferase class I/II-fold pyridoxal phosphate-dependent enzyme [Candidatus Pedobacter colombiensis]|uniref:Aminotransferase class I/II-fold pyridoxal phosphate-dependent enzyme n=1 Tax=Candidatus Pedobacter colombiensis TaxID=3121371 RepID=A0AAJ5W9W5_9SPHI|nr:aminotransferase class I/II-fold pyridoxal phosphate-dependent enzyme [Pedobacter sp.]WEK20420.1 MAG: aminotransferase class I/II-fold pyridoxal phosphate-dependent enzyme [Pedobacter sp.]
MRNIDFEKASFKDFEDPAGMCAFERARYFNEFLDYLEEKERLNYRFETTSSGGPLVELSIPFMKEKRDYVSLVSNDYLGFSQHHLVKKAACFGIQYYGAGSGASPAIGGHYSFHRELEEKIAAFFNRDSAIIYTTGYTANSATLLALLGTQDLVITDMKIHASMFEGCNGKNQKTFRHNDLEHLEMILKSSRDQYHTRFVVVDGVYSQDGDLALLDQIVKLVHQYEGYVVMDDAHGVGVIGKTGRGVIELQGLYKEVDIITGTFSKTFGHLGGYVIADPELIRYLKFQSRQHLFSVTATPASMCILKAIELIDEQPEWRDLLWENVNYFTAGLRSLGLDIGNTQSAIVPVKIGDIALTNEVSRRLLHAGVYANPIMYPAVSKKDSRIRMSLMATHKREHVDRVLNAFEDISRALPIRRLSDCNQT